MSVISEGQRRRMYEAFVAQFGEEVADTVMEHLPPVGWADVATKQDLAHLREVLEARMDAFIAELRGEFRGEMGKQTRVIVAWNGAMLVGLAGVAVAAAQFTA